MRKKVDPTIELKSDGETVEKHPSYGMISFSRISGGHDNLFGSSISHQNHVELRIFRGRRGRNINTDWYFADSSPLISVKLSSTQFAELITTMNIGSGVPCTLHHADGEMMPECPERHQRQEVQDEFKSDMQKVTADLQSATKQLDKLLEPGAIKKSDIINLSECLNRAIQELACNVPFAQECFDEACDKTVSEAKGEIDAAFVSTVNRLGGQKLQELLDMDSAPQTLTIESTHKNNL